MCIGGGVKFLRMLGVCLALLLLAGAAAWFFRDTLVDTLVQSRLGSELSRLVGADVEVTDSTYREGTLRVGRGVVSGPNLPFARLQFEGVRTVVEWRQLGDFGDSPLHIEAENIDLVWRNHGTQRADGGAAAGAPRKEVPPIDILADRFSFRHEDATEWSIRETKARLRYDKGSWSFSASGGRLENPGWPSLEIERLTGEQQGRGWRIASFALKNDEGALAGSATLDPGGMSGEFSWQDFKLDGFLPQKAGDYFTARSSGDAVLERGELRGQMKLAGAETRNLPALVKLASIFTGEDYSTVPWDSFRFEFVRKADGSLTFSNLVAVSPKGLAVRGSGATGASSLSADLQLGLRREGRPWLVAFMPILFRQEKEGYLWTPVKVGGTPQAPSEDLTTRVVAALAVAPATQAVESAAEIPATAVEAAGGLLRSLLGR
jgi:hypothetical protein